MATSPTSPQLPADPFERFSRLEGLVRHFFGSTFGGLCKLTKAAHQALSALEASQVDVLGTLEARRALAGHSLIDDMIMTKESQLAAHDAAICSPFPRRRRIIVYEDPHGVI